MEFHISRTARSRYDVDETLFNYVGNVVFGDVLASRKLAARMTEVRLAKKQEGEPNPDVANAGALFAMGLIDELSHALVAQYRKTVDPQVLPAALAWFSQRVTEGNVDGLLRAFVDQFPNTSVYRGEETVSEWLATATDGLPHREAALEELMMLWLANSNPAYAPYRELFDDENLEKRTIYKQVIGRLDAYFATRPPFSATDGTLLDVLRAPMLASPDSLTGQLDYIREHWAPYIGDEIKQVLLATDVLKEEEIAIWMRFHPGTGGGPGGQDGPTDWGMFGFEGDEYRGFEGLQTAEARRRWLLAQQGVQEAPVHEYEAFSPDQAWMPTVVLIAKSTYVWLEQLSKQYKRHIYRLDQIPQEELQCLADRGLNGLWLIGLWERSVASQTIKRMRGQHDAVASAYSLRDYRIAEDLGGERAYEVLRDKAKAVGIRLASDMVPNHMGIDSTWVIEHPDWFVSREQSPFPVYSFQGPDLSPDGRVEIRIEDHYYDQTDAAVVFELKDRRTHKTEYVYHGNDGTTFAWNDTAQLNYSKAEVREQVIRTILEVAKLFPIIRFDAAMTLAKKHVQRLWFPLPGEGRSIPSRSEDAMTQAEFDALMPHEFWREVVDRVAVEVPGTLLLAEAFWLLEGYFVRTLGMHRVYNSAFMNMLRDEENAKYRSYLKKTIEFDPDILKRYVNFMSNPDERTAIDQFGTGDKYFGVCTLMATLPGLPMFGHGQIEAYTERYGMEYKTAKFDEWPKEDLVARHQREIMPLLKDRSLFAESSYFRMYDFQTPFGGVDESVFAFTNRENGRRAVILFNNRYESTRGTIHWSVEQMDKGSGNMRGETLGDALRLPWDERALVAYRDSATGLEYLRWSDDVRRNGMTFDLRGYQYVVLLSWRELWSSEAKPWDRLCHVLQGAGVPNLEESLSNLRLREVDGAVRQMLEREMIDLLRSLEDGDSAGAAIGQDEEDEARDEQPIALEEVAVAEPGGSQLSPVDMEEMFVEAKEHGAARIALQEARLGPMLDRVDAFYAAATRVQEYEEPGNEKGWARRRYRMGTRLAQAAGSRSGAHGVELRVAWAALGELGAAGEERASAFDRLQLRSSLAHSLMTLGFEHEEAWRGAAKVRTVLRYGATAEDRLDDLPQSFWEDPDVRWLVGVNESGGKTYFNKESFEQMLELLALPGLMREAGGAAIGAPSVTEQMKRARQVAHASGYDVAQFTAGAKAIREQPSSKGAGSQATAEERARTSEPVALKVVSTNTVEVEH
jgi:glycosidase